MSVNNLQIFKYPNYFTLFVIHPTQPAPRGKSNSLQPQSTVPQRSFSHTGTSLATGVAGNNGGTTKPLRSNSMIPSIPVPVNRPEMDLISPLSPTSTSLKAAKKPIIGPQTVSCLSSRCACVFDLLIRFMVFCL